MRSWRREKVSGQFCQQLHQKIDYELGEHVIHYRDRKSDDLDKNELTRAK